MKRLIKAQVADKEVETDKWSDPGYCLDQVKQKGWFLRFVKNQTPEICLVAVKQDGYILELVKNQTPEICLAAVKQNGYALQYVKNQTPEICLAAVKQYGHALQYVKEQTPELCLEAVKQDGYALQYVKEQTYELCLVAVRQDGYALRFVKNQAPEICLAAVEQNPGAVKYVPENIQKQISKQISLQEKLKNFVDITMFKHIGEGASADAIQINNSQIIRISKDIPPPVPKDPHINQRQGFIKVESYYIEIFPMLKDVGRIPETELEPISRYLEEKYNAFDLHENNFGRDSNTGEIKLLDPGSLPAINISHQDLKLVSFNKTRLIKSQQHGVWNSPISDGIPTNILEDQNMERLKRLIQDKKYDPVKEADTESDVQEFNFPPYKVKAVRFTFNTMDDNGRDFFNVSQNAKNDQWAMSLLDQSGNQISTKTVNLSNGIDTSSILELEAMKFSQESQL